jgi:hypothetical protein
MALSAEQLAKAKAEAIQILEYSIYTLAFVLGVEDADLEPDMENPIDMSLAENSALTAQYDAYECLKLQLAALVRLQA